MVEEQCLWHSSVKADIKEGRKTNFKMLYLRNAHKWLSTLLFVWFLKHSWNMN